MKIDLTEKSKELKAFVSQFETTMFLGDLTSVMQFIRFNSPMNLLQGLSSPQRQLLYLAGLNVTSPIDETKPLKAQYSDDDFEHMKRLLNEVEDGYEQFFLPKPDEITDEDWKEKRKIAMPTFLSYFNQGLLNYEEQIIERIEEYFTPFNDALRHHFGLEVKDFIEIYNAIDKVPNNFLMEKINPKEGQQTWEEFGEEMQEKGLLPWEWQKYMPQHFVDEFNWMHDNGMMQRYSKQAFIDEFGKTKAEAFLNAFTCKRNETDFLYYTEKNIIHSKPIFNIDDNDFQLIEAHQLIQAVYNTLFEFCATPAKLAEKFYAVRADKLEDKVQRVFERFFRNKAFVYRGYYTQEKHEQDLLFLYEGLALIVEVKASKRDEPRREPEKAYPLILSNFEETIQKGYDQAYRVKSKFIQGENLQVYKENSLDSHIIDINTKHYYKAFSLIITLERFGQIQTDLSALLEIYDNDKYPWSICIDDLEVFLLQLEKLSKRKTDLMEFLSIREHLQGRLFTADELEVCGAFLMKKLNLKEVNKQDHVYKLNPTYTDIFDQTYQTKGLGFAKEKNLDIKTSGKYMPLGGI